jgi:hypothetical protein
MTSACDEFKDMPIVKDSVTADTDEGFIIEGEIYHVRPYNQWMYLEFDTPVGLPGGMYVSFMAQLGKWGFVRERVEESSEISPAHAQYQQWIQQKQQIEAQIKQGLAGISSAISDFELLFHDLRKYRDFMNHFENMARGKEEKKPELVEQNLQSLKAIFIDQVDANTGEGIALRSIAARWPTIIADFMRLKETDVDQKGISSTYKISEAEGVILATKNKLFLDWLATFKEAVTGRYERIRGMMEARKKSIDEYKNMLRPYIARYRTMREMGETAIGRKLSVEGSIGIFRPPGTFMPTSDDWQTVWAWRAFVPPEIYRPGAEGITDAKDVFKLDFPKEFKDWLKLEFQADKDVAKKYGQQKVSPTGIEPLDKWVLALFPKIEEKYKIKFRPSEILEVRSKFIKQFDAAESPDWAYYWPKSPYFMVLELGFDKKSLRIGDRDSESMVFASPFRAYMDTQNMILLRMLEIKAREKELENYISDMLGETAITKMKLPEKDEKGNPLEEDVKTSIRNVLGNELPFTMGKPKPGFTRSFTALKLNETMTFLRRKVGLDIRLGIPGKYEPHLEDRITEHYLKELGEVLWGPTVEYLKSMAGVPL